MHNFSTRVAQYVYYILHINKNYRPVLKLLKMIQARKKKSKSETTQKNIIQWEWFWISVFPISTSKVILLIISPTLAHHKLVSVKIHNGFHSSLDLDADDFQWSSQCYNCVQLSQCQFRMSSKFKASKSWGALPWCNGGRAYGHAGLVCITFLKWSDRNIAYNQR